MAGLPLDVIVKNFALFRRFAQRQMDDSPEAEDIAQEAAIIALGSQDYRGPGTETKLIWLTVQTARLRFFQGHAAQKRGGGGRAGRTAYEFHCIDDIDLPPVSPSQLLRIEVNEAFAALDKVGPGVLDAVLVDAEVIKPPRRTEFAKGSRPSQDNGRLAGMGYAELTRRLLLERGPNKA